MRERRAPRLGMLRSLPIPPQAPDGLPVDEDDAPRLVPVGTWASDGDEPSETRTLPDESSDRLVRISRPPPRMEGRSESPVPIITSSTQLQALVPKSGTASASPITAQATVPRPPFLASVLMRKRDEQHDPICHKRGRIMSALGGALAAALAFASGGIDLRTAFFGAFGGMLALSAFISLPDVRRSQLVLGLGLSTAVLGLTLRESAAGATALFAVLATSGGLVLRSRRVGSVSARLLVAFGVAASIAWLGIAGLSGAIATELTFASLLRPAITLGLVITLALVLLAFVDDHGPSGAGYFASVMLCWGGLEAVDFVWQNNVLDPAQAGALGAAAALPATSIALAQAFGRRLGRGRSAATA